MNFCNQSEEELIGSLGALYNQYGYLPYKMSKFEEYDLYVRNKSFLVSDSIITFTDTNGKLMALKPDVTLSIIKNCQDIPGYVKKVYYNENVYRVSKGSKLFKEIMQMGLECIGATNDYTVYEVLMLAAESLGCMSSAYVLDISELDIISHIIDALGLPDSKRRALFACIGEKNISGIDELCQSESANKDVLEILEKLIASDGEPSEIIGMLSSCPLASRFEKELAGLDRITTALCQRCREGHIRIDFSVINDMNYYNGIVFNGFIPGVPESILSGGQYHNLMRKMGRKSDAIGFAVYLDLLSRLLTADDGYDTDIVLLYDEKASMNDVITAVTKLSDGGRRVSAQLSLPPKIRYKKLMKLTPRGVETIG